MPRFSLLFAWVAWRPIQAAAFLACVGIAGLAEGHARDFEIQSLDWRGSVESGQTIEVVNRFGDIRARFGGYEGEVEISGTAQHFEDEGPRLGLRGTSSDTGLDISVGFENEEGQWVTERDPSHRKRIDLVVFVPLRGRLRVVTDHGLIEIQGTKSPVVAESRSGMIRARKSSSPLNLRSDSGQVVVSLPAGVEELEHSIVTGSGEQSIYLPGDGHVRIDMAGNGLISTDVSLEMDFQHGRDPIRRATAQTGKGTGLLTLRSDTGRIRVVQRPSPSEARRPPATTTRASESRP